MWPFKKKEEPRVTCMPGYVEEKLLNMVDDIRNSEESTRVKEYRLWKFIEGICPETREGVWAANLDIRAKPRLIEALK